MYQIIIKGEASTDFKDKSKLDGISCEDDFTQYFHDESYANNVLQSGYLDFKFEDNKLWSVTTYTSNRELTEKEIESLKNYTQGQWSDGIGEGFEQFSCKVIDGEEVFISPWFPGQELTVEQKQIENN